MPKANQISLCGFLLVRHILTVNYIQIWSTSHFFLKKKQKKKKEPKTQAYTFKTQMR